MYIDSTDCDRIFDLVEDFGIEVFQRGDFDFAERIFQSSIEEAKKQGVSGHCLFSKLINLAVVYHTQGIYIEAERLYRKALQIINHELGVDHPGVPQFLENYADLLKKMGRDEEAAGVEVCSEVLSISQFPKFGLSDDMEELDSLTINETEAA